MGLLGEIKNAISEEFGNYSPGINKLQQMQPSQSQQQAKPQQMQPATNSGLYNPQLEKLIDMALADGELTEKEKQVLFKKAETMGIDLDEFEMVLDARLYEKTQSMQNQPQIVRTQTAAPKSDKLGDIRKCPACGAMVPAVAGSCPECGYEFSNVAANLSSKQLSDMLLQATNDKKKEEIIETFPIPAAKADLVEFLTALKPRCMDTDSSLSKAYLKKYDECINKAKLLFPNDNLLMPIIQGYNADVKTIKKKRVFSWIKTHKKLTFLIVFFVIALILSLVELLKPASVKDDVAKCREAIESALQNKDLKEATTLILEYDHSDKKELPVNQVVDACLEQDEITLAEQVVNKYKDSYSFHDDFGNIEMALDNYYLEKEQYNKILAEGDDKTMGTKIKLCVTDMCKKGKKTEAYQFVKENIDKVHEYSDGSGSQDKLVNGRGITRKDIQKHLNDYIKNY